MKIPDHEKSPLVKKGPPRTPPKPKGVATRMREEGITHLTPNQVRDRMREHNLTYEEALKYQPMTPTEKGRKGRKRSRWGRWISDEEFQARKAAEKSMPSYKEPDL